MERQSLLKEIGTNAKLQYLIDRTKDRYRPIIWPNFFAWKPATSITYETLIGEAGIGAAASVVAYDSEAPLRTRRHVKKLTGEIPSLREKFRMGEKELQDYIAMSAGINGDAQAIMKLIFDDVKLAAEAPHKRLDIFALEAISTGEITLSTTNNPDGIVTEEAIDFGMPSANKIGTTGAIWSAGGSTAKPISDIMAIMELAEANGHKIDKMLMRRSTFNNFRKADEVKDYVTGWAVGRNTAKINVSLPLVNEFLAGEGLPQIVIIDASIGIEKNGVISAYNPFDQYNVAFVPTGSLGDMLNAPIVEKTFPQKHVLYANYNNVLVKKWGSTDPVSEFTGCELNAFPSWKTVNACYLLNTNNTTTFE